MYVYVWKKGGGEGKGGSVVDLQSGDFELHSTAIVSLLAPVEMHEMASSWRS